MGFCASRLIAVPGSLLWGAAVLRSQCTEHLGVAVPNICLLWAWAGCCIATANWEFVFARCIDNKARLCCLNTFSAVCKYHVSSNCCTAEAVSEIIRSSNSQINVTIVRTKGNAFSYAYVCSKRDRNKESPLCSATWRHVGRVSLDMCCPFSGTQMSALVSGLWRFSRGYDECTCLHAEKECVRFEALKTRTKKVIFFGRDVMSRRLV